MTKTVIVSPPMTDDPRSPGIGVTISLSLVSSGSGQLLVTGEGGNR